ncbi:unnamed protein product [Sphagnum compactum]
MISSAVFLQSAADKKVMSHKVDLGNYKDGLIRGVNGLQQSSTRFGSPKFMNAESKYRVLHPVTGHAGRDQPMMSSCSKEQHNEDDTASYKGIRYRPELDRFISEIRPALPRKRKIWLGTYRTAAEAATAFDVGIFYTGKKIPFNFPETAKLLPPLDENLTQDERHVAIQKRAKLAAAAKLQQQQQRNMNFSFSSSERLHMSSHEQEHHIRSSCSSNSQYEHDEQPEINLRYCHLKSSTNYSQEHPSSSASPASYNMPKFYQFLEQSHEQSLNCTTLHRSRGN